jgi:lipoate-protein ligase A
VSVNGRETTWRLIIDPPADGVRNMATDHALFERVQSGSAPVLRLYRWDPPCLSIGRNQPAVYDFARLRAAGTDLVRRPTGGRAVLHDRELTYAIAAPVDTIGRPRAAFVRINEAIVLALRKLHVPASLAGSGGPGPLDSADPCFSTPTAGEIIVDGGKLVGSAQRYERNAILQHGSLLLDGDQSALAGWISEPTGATRAAVANAPTAPATLRSLIGSVPAWEDLCDALAGAVREVLDVRLERDTLTREEQARLGTLESLYVDDEWTWRR